MSIWPRPSRPATAFALGEPERQAHDFHSGADLFQGGAGVRPIHESFSDRPDEVLRAKFWLAQRAQHRRSLFKFSEHLAQRVLLALQRLAELNSHQAIFALLKMAKPL